MYDIFISHSSLDKSSLVEPLVNELINLGLKVWYDKYSIHKGDKIKDSIINGIKESLIFISIVSKNYYKSNWANLELGILQALHPDNFIPLISADVKNVTGQKYPFLLDYNYIEINESIQNISNELNCVVVEKKQENGMWHIEKTDLAFLLREMRSYNSFKLDQLAIHLSRVIKLLHSDLLSAMNEIKLVTDLLLNDVATIENIFIAPDKSSLDIFINIDFLNLNLQEHLKYLQKLYMKNVCSINNFKNLSQEDLYLIQFSIFSVIEWYMITYFRKPVFKQKKIITIAPEELTNDDIFETYQIEKLVLPPDLIARPDTVMKWHLHNPLTIIGARDSINGKLIGFFNTLPISDNMYNKIKIGNFDDTVIPIEDIRQYDIPGFYKLYLCSFCIHPSYNTTTAFKVIYTNFIDFLLNLASERDIYISHIIADGVTPKGASLCESIGMSKIQTSCHESTVYEATLIPPTYTTIKLNNVIGNKLLTYYKRKYNEYKDLF